MSTIAVVAGGGRWIRARYLDFAVGVLTVTPAGRELVSRAEQAGRSLLDQQDALGRLLGAARWSPEHDPDAAHVGDADYVSASEYETAVRAYHRAVRSRG